MGVHGLRAALRHAGVLSRPSYALSDAFRMGTGTTATASENVPESVPELDVESEPGAQKVGSARVTLNDVARKSASTEGRPIVHIDGPSLVHRLHWRTVCFSLPPRRRHSSTVDAILTHLLLCDYSALRRVLLATVIDPLVAAGFDVVVYFDAVSGTDSSVQKLGTVSERAEQRIDALLKVTDHIELRRSLSLHDLSGMNLLPPLATSEIIDCLKSTDHCSVRRCIGEADFALAAHGKTAAFVLSDDSDLMVAPGVLCAPIDSLARDDSSGQWVLDLVGLDDVMRALGLPGADDLPELLCLIGNDYSAPILRESPALSAICSHLLVEASSATNETASPSITRIQNAVALVSNPALFSKLTSAPEWKELLPAIEFTRKVIWSPAAVLSEAQLPLSDHDAELLRGIVAGDYPSKLLGASRHGFLIAPVVFEHLETPSAPRLCHLITAAFFALGDFKGGDCVQYEREGLKFAPVVVTLDKLPPSFRGGVSHLPNAQTSLSTRTHFIASLLASLRCVHDGWNLDEIQRFVFGKQDLSLGLVTLLFTIGLSAQGGDALSSSELAALISTVCLLETKRVPDTFLQSISAEIDMRAVTIMSRFGVVCSNLLGLFQCVSVSHEPPSEMLHGRLFLYFLQCYRDMTLDDEVAFPVQESIRKCDLLRSDEVDTCLQVARDLQGVFVGREFPNHLQYELFEDAEGLLSAGLDELNSNEDEVVSREPPSSDEPVLPVAAYKKSIVDAVYHNPVIVIEAETGAGKSSQVPQYMLETVRDPFVVVTQPRRIAAISLAQRVAFERGEAIGQSVGYAIGQENLWSRRTRILFVTSGWLLQKLLFDSGFLFQCSHVVLDEIHERSIDSDLLSLLIREKLEQAIFDNVPAPKLVLMSATLNAGLFAQYFRLPDENDLDDPRGPMLRDVPVLSVGAKRYATEIIHLDQIKVPGVFGSDIDRVSRALSRNGGIPGKVEADLQRRICLKLIANLARDTHDSKVGATVLVFMAGMMDLEEMYETMDESLVDLNLEFYHNDALEPLADESQIGESPKPQVAAITSVPSTPSTAHGSLQVILLHSMIDKVEQMRVFEDVPAGVTRVVLATNIAESSVTLPAVKYVIDFGLVRQVVHDERNGITALQTELISKASAKQRAGRAGRICDGIVYRLYPVEIHERAMPDFDLPEMIRLNLAATVLRLKVLADGAEEDSLLADVAETLRHTIQPPPDSNVAAATEELLSNGALEMRTFRDQAEEDEFFERGFRTEGDERLARSKVSALGHLLSHLPFDLRFGRLIALGARSGVFLPHAIIIAVGCTIGKLFVRPHPANSPIDRLFDLVPRAVAGMCKYDAGTLSDCLAFIRFYVDAIYCNVDSKTRHVMSDLAVNHKRRMTFTRTVTEVARRLLPILPYHEKHLSVLISSDARRVERSLKLDDAACDFLRLMLFQAFVGSNHGRLIVGSIKYPSNPGQVLRLGHDGLPTADQVVPAQTITAVCPAEILERQSLHDGLLPVSRSAEIFPGSAQSDNKDGKRKSSNQKRRQNHWEDNAARDGPAAFSFLPKAEEIDHNAVLSAASLPEFRSICDPALGYRQFLSLFHRGVCKIIARPNVVAGLTSGLSWTDWKFSGGQEFELSTPTRMTKVEWGTAGKQKSKVGVDAYSPIGTVIGRSPEFHKLPFVCICANEMFIGERGQVLICENITAIPEGRGLLALLMLMFSREAHAGDSGLTFDSPPKESGKKKKGEKKGSSKGASSKGGSGQWLAAIQPAAAVHLQPIPCEPQIGKDFVQSSTLRRFSELCNTILDDDPCGPASDNYQPEVLQHILSVMPLKFTIPKGGLIRNEKFTDNDDIFDAAKRTSRSSAPRNTTGGAAADVSTSVPKSLDAYPFEAVVAGLLLSRCPPLVTVTSKQLEKAVVMVQGNGVTVRKCRRGSTLASILRGSGWFIRGPKRENSWQLKSEGFPFMGTGFDGLQEIAEIQSSGLGDRAERAVQFLTPSSNATRPPKEKSKNKPKKSAARDQMRTPVVSLASSNDNDNDKDNGASGSGKPPKKGKVSKKDKLSSNPKYRFRPGAFGDGDAHADHLPADDAGRGRANSRGRGFRGRGSRNRGGFRGGRGGGSRGRRGSRGSGGGGGGGGGSPAPAFEFGV